MTRAFSKAALVLALVLVASAIGWAQSLQRVTVTGFVLSADTAHPHEGVPFHLIVTLRLSERVSSVENLQLPLLAGLGLLGDLRSTATGSQGTHYREVVTIVARHAGTLTIPPATFDAIDARDGQAKQYSSNALMLRVAGPPGTSGAVMAAKVLVSVGVAMMVLGLVLAVLLSRRRAALAVADSEPQPTVQPAPLPFDPLGEAREALERDPTRAGAFRARVLVWRMVGASDGETLADVMDRVGDSQPRLASLLPAIERAAFTYDGDVRSAIDRALAALREMR